MLIYRRGTTGRSVSRDWQYFKYKYLQVAQLSLANPRDALHYGKRQNYKTLTPLLSVICHHVARIDIA